MAPLRLSAGCLTLLLYTIAAGALAAQQPLPPKPAPSTTDQQRIDQLIRQLGGASFAEREQAMKELVAVGVPALEPLRKALQSKDPELIRRAQECIPIIERNVQIVTLIKALKDKDSETRAQAAKQLGKFGPMADAAVPALLEAFEDEDTSVWLDAKYAIAQIGPKAKKAVPKLIELLKKREGRRSRTCDAAFVLGKIGPAAEEAVPALLDVLENYSTSAGRAEAARALGLIGGIDEKLIPALLNGLKDLDVRVRRNSAEALGNIGKEPAACVPALLEALKKHKGLSLEDEALSSYPTRTIICALGRFGPGAKEAVPLLIDILKEPKQKNGLREESIETLRRIGPEAKEAIPMLNDLMKGMYNGIYSKEASRALDSIQRKTPE